MEFVIDRRLRRGGLSRREWQQRQVEVHGHHAYYDPKRLRYGVALGDGQQLIVDTPRGVFGKAPEKHSLTLSGGGGGGSENYLWFEDALWLWPLPPEGPLEVVAQWPAFGIAEARVVLDRGPLVALAAQARPVWSN